MAAITDQLDWAHALEADLGVPQGGNNDTTLVGWEQAEGGAGPQFGVAGNVTDYNPIDVSLTTGPQGYGYDPGTGKFYAGASPTPGNNPPIAAFSDWTTGLQATADRLQEPFAATILGDLRSNAPTSTTAAAVAASGWGTPDFAGVGGSGAPASGSSGTATTQSLNLNPLDLFGIPGTVGSATASAVLPFLAKALLVLAGIGILIVAAAQAAKKSGVAPQAAPLAELAAA